MVGINVMKPPHRCEHPVLPSFPNRSWGSRSMENMASYIPEQWHPSGEAERIVPQREVFRSTHVQRPHTPNSLSLQLSHAKPVSLEETLGRPEWVHASQHPNLLHRNNKPKDGLTNAKLKDIKNKLQAAAYGRGDVGDSDDDWEELFKLYDSDGGGTLDFEEFKQVIRKHGRVSVRDINDIQLRQVFEMIDEDGSEEIDGGEFSEWLQKPVPDNNERVIMGDGKAAGNADSATSVLKQIKAKRQRESFTSSFGSDNNDATRSADVSSMSAMARTSTRHDPTDRSLELGLRAPTADEALLINGKFTTTSKALAELRFPVRKDGVVTLDKQTSFVDAAGESSEDEEQDDGGDGSAARREIAALEESLYHRPARAPPPPALQSKATVIPSRKKGFIRPGLSVPRDRSFGPNRTILGALDTSAMMIDDASLPAAL
jgi:Ca2+-binding EF-hand superfamily protein